MEWTSGNPEVLGEPAQFRGSLVQGVGEAG